MTRFIKRGLVSVVVASYNHANFLDSRMKTLVNQTYKDIEIIVIDDFSSDNSRDILKKYKSNNRVKLIFNSTNKGWVSVSNQGLKLALGEYIIFANCDDYCDPRLVEVLVKKIEINKNIAIAYSRSYLIDEYGHILGDDYSLRERSFKSLCFTSKLVSKKIMRKFLLHSCVIPNLSAALIRRDHLLNMNGFSSEYKVCSDWDLFLKISNFYDFYYVNQPLNFFRQHKKTVRSANKDRIYYYEIIKLVLNSILKTNLTFYEKLRLKFNVMHIWAKHVLSPTLKGISNFTSFSSLVLKVDPFSILLFPFALLLNILSLPIFLVKYFLKGRV